MTPFKMNPSNQSRPTKEEIQLRAEQMMERPARTREGAMWEVEGMADGYYPELIAEYYPGWKRPDFLELVRMVRALEDAGQG